MTQVERFPLETVPAFSGLSPAELNLIAEYGERVEFPRETLIIRKGDPAEFLYLVRSGRAVLREDGRLLAYTGRGITHFGLIEGNDAYTYDAIVDSEEIQLFRIGRNVIESLFSLSPKIERHLRLLQEPLGAYLFINHLRLKEFDFSEEKFIHHFRHQIFRPGQVVIREGDDGDSFYLIAAGRAQVTKLNQDGIEIDVMSLATGDYFGEIALLESGRREATVRATEELSVFSLSRKDFDTVLSSKKGRFIRKYLYDRIRTYALGLEEAMIGRGPACQICLEGERIAEEHAVLTTTRRRDGHIDYAVRPLATTSHFMVYVNKKPIKTDTVIDSHDELYFGDYKVVFDPNREQLSFQRATYYALKCDQARYQIKGRTIIDDVSFTAESNELVCIMGPSGCGKSTLLDIISGKKAPKSGRILYNQDDLHGNLEFFSNIFGFVPQDDILFGELTVYENLYFSARLREPFLDESVLEDRIDAVLERLRLTDRKHDRVGSVEKKGLSGGQRKRVNIARELIFDPHVLFLDEPTSGLSSKDSEEIVGFLRDLADMGKLVVTVLHQPNSKIYKMFDRTVLLDQGGKLVYNGPVLGCIDYMKAVDHDDFPTVCPCCGTSRPDLIFDILERSDDSGNRLHAPQFWQDRFRERHGDLAPRENRPAKHQPIERQRIRFREDLRQFKMLLHRNFLVKIRNHSNMAITLGVPIAIALLLGVILHHTPSDTIQYTLFRNKLISIYLFVGVIFSIFLGLTNSAREIVREQAIFRLESDVRLRIRWFVLAKFTVLGVIGAAQMVLFLAIADFMLRIPGMFQWFFLFMYLICLLGIAVGLVLSSVFRTSESVVNWIPLVLIPQIILGGALIEYKDMGKGVFLDADQFVPELCQFIPSRWTHEGLVVVQATLNHRDAAIDSATLDIRNVGIRIRDLRQAPEDNQTEIQRLRDRRKTLQTDKSRIDSMFPNESFRNEGLEDAVLQGDGTYVGKKRELVAADPVYQSGWVTIYPIIAGLPPAESKGVRFITPFYSEWKAVVVDGYFFEFQTSYFNVAVLVLMIAVSLICCLAILKLRKRGERRRQRIDPRWFYPAWQLRIQYQKNKEKMKRRSY